MKEKLPEFWQKTPISYYGGKQTMLPVLLKIIPEHKIYIEPFFGGGSLFWAKKISPIEIINDMNDNVYNFYSVLQNNFNELKKRVDATIFSRNSYKSAIVIYHNPTIFSKIERAWAFWYTTNTGFNNIIGNISLENKRAVNLRNKINAFTDKYSERLSKVFLECDDACNIIRSKDNTKAFVYVDPPYVGAHQGHYAGYNQEHFNTLLNTLAKIEGKFLLSSYHNEILDKFVLKHKWYQCDITKHLGASNIKNRKKIEVLTANYPISV